MASLYFCHYLIKYTVLQLHLKQCYNFDKKTWTKRLLDEKTLERKDRALIL